MVSTIINQPQTAVKQEIIYRAPITGRICRAFIIHEGDALLKVQGEDYNGDPRWISKDDVLSYTQGVEPCSTEGSLWLPPAVGDEKPARQIIYTARGTAFPLRDLKVVAERMNLAVADVRRNTRISGRAHSKAAFQKILGERYIRITSLRRLKRLANILETQSILIMYGGDDAGIGQSVSEELSRITGSPVTRLDISDVWRLAGGVQNQAPQGFSLTIKPVDARRAHERYSYLADERRDQLECAREYYRIPAVWTDSAVEIAKSQRAYDRAAHHVARLEAMSSGQEPDPWVRPCPILYLPAMFTAANAWLQLEAWRATGRPRLPGHAGGRPEADCRQQSCPPQAAWKPSPAPTGDEPVTRGHNPFILMISGRV